MDSVCSPLPGSIGCFEKRRGPRGNLETPELQVKRKEEILVVAESFNRMHRSLESTIRMLGSPVNQIGVGFPAKLTTIVVAQAVHRDGF